MATFTTAQMKRQMHLQAIEDAILSQSFQSPELGKATGTILASLAGHNVKADEFFAVLHGLEDDKEVWTDASGCVHRIVRNG